MLQFLMVQMSLCKLLEPLITYILLIPRSARGVVIAFASAAKTLGSKALVLRHTLHLVAASFDHRFSVNSEGKR